MGSGSIERLLSWLAVSRSSESHGQSDDPAAAAALYLEWFYDGQYRTGNEALASVHSECVVPEDYHGTDMVKLYQTERFDPPEDPLLTYEFPVSPGQYYIALHFAEIFSGNGGIGRRVFDVFIEDVLVLDDYDIFAEVGLFAATFEEFEQTVVDGALTIRFEKVADNPKISAIEIARLDGIGDLIDTQMKLAASADYQAVAKKFGELSAGPSETTLSQVVATAGDVGDPKPVTVVTSATMAAGHASEALAWCGEMLEYSVGLTGDGAMLATSAAGSFFDIAFLAGYASGADADAANAALTGDAGYMERLDAAGELFVNGTANRVVLAALP